MRAAPLVALVLWSGLATFPALAAPSLAAFDFELVNTSLEPTRADEEARLRMLDALLAEELLRRDAFALVDVAPVRAEAARNSSLRQCQGCELDLARRLGAEYAALGWVQKVSNLILNVNIEIREVATNRVALVKSVDMRGNNDESWIRAVRYLVRDIDDRRKANPRYGL